jgi:hypothetical protein
MSMEKLPEGQADLQALNANFAKFLATNPNLAEIGNVSVENTAGSVAGKVDPRPEVLDRNIQKFLAGDLNIDNLDPKPAPLRAEYVYVPDHQDNHWDSTDGWGTHTDVHDEFTPS